VDVQSQCLVGQQLLNAIWPLNGDLQAMLTLLCTCSIG